MQHNVKKYVLVCVCLFLAGSIAGYSAPLSQNEMKPKKGVDVLTREQVVPFAKKSVPVLKQVWKEKAVPIPSIPCSPAVDLTSGVPYAGDTTGELNDYSGTDYPGLSWGEYGPDVVHRIVTTRTTDLRILVEPDPTTDPDLDVILIPDDGRGCDTSNWIYAGDYAIYYPDAPAGTYYIIVDGYTSADYGPYTLTVAAAADVLVVDDDGSDDTTQCTNGCPDTTGYYTAIMSSLSPKVPYTVWNVDVKGSVDPVVLNNAKIVFWIVGAAYNSGKTISATDQQNLRRFLRLGGRIYVEGQDILWDIAGGQDGYLPDGNVFADFFKIYYVYQDVWTPSDLDSLNTTFRLNGVPGDPISDLLNCNDLVYVFDISKPSLDATVPFNPYVDSILTRYGEPVYYNAYKSGNTKSQKPAGVRYAASLGISDYYKTVFFAFSPTTNEGPTRDSRLQRLIEKLLDWLDRDDTTTCKDNDTAQAFFDDSVSGNNNGYPDSPETFDVSIQVTNNGTVSKTYEVYVGFEDYWMTRYTPYCQSVTVAAGSSATVTFQLRNITGTPIGYRDDQLFNIALNDGTSSSYCWTAGFGAFVGQADVLLVKDEVLYSNTTGVETYQTILNNLGYSVATWDTAVYGSPTYNTRGLTNDYMMNYPFVIWFTGLDYRFTLLPDPYDQSLGINPETEINTFLTNRYTDKGVPARLILSSQDYLYEKYNGNSQDIPTTDFAYNQLKVFHVDQDIVKDATSILNGIDGVWPTEKLAMGLQNGLVFTNYADVVFPNLDETGTTHMWSFTSGPGAGQTTGIMNLRKDRSARFVFMPFAFENMQDAAAPSTKQRYLERIMCMMLMNATDIHPPCGYTCPSAMPEVTLYVKKTGNASNKNEIELSWAGVDFTNTAGEPIAGQYRIRRNDPNSPCASASSLPVYATTPNTNYIEGDAFGSSNIFCYNIIDYIDYFGHYPGDLTCP